QALAHAAVGNSAVFEEPPSTRPDGESSPEPFSVGRELGGKRLTAYTSVCKVSPPRMSEAHKVLR
ncbi:MAG TPA: hypothetical protein VGK96_13090, partial [Candidatus Sulfotelmatobacter sp.]